MANRHVSHIKSNQTVTTTVNGQSVVSPKLPTAEDLVYGEIAVNYADGYERLSIKNSNNDIISFISEEEVNNIRLKIELVTASALNDLNQRLIDTEDTVDGIETTVSELSTTVSGLSSTVSGLSSDLDALETTVEENEQVVSAALNTLHSSIPTATSELTNDSGFITSASLQVVSANNNGLMTPAMLSTLNSVDTTLTEVVSAIEEDEETIAESLNDLNSRIASVEGALMISVTYSELVALKSGGNLIPGANYRITDYQTVVVANNASSFGGLLSFSSANHQFDIVVMALSTTELSERASAVRHAGDTYFANSNLSAWDIKYTLSNDTSKLMVELMGVGVSIVDTTNGKGVIYYMKDEWNNECCFDFKNILNGDYYLFTEVVTENNEDSYYDITVSGTKDAYNNKVYSLGNVFVGDSSHNTFLNNTVGMGCVLNTIGYNCNNITFNAGSVFCAIGNNCDNIVFGENCNECGCGDNCSRIKFGASCNLIIFGDVCSDLVFADRCDNISPGYSSGVRKGYYRNIEVKSGNTYITIDTNEPLYSSEYLQNIVIDHNVNDGSTPMTITHPTTNDYYTTTYTNPASQTVYVTPD